MANFCAIDAIVEMNIKLKINIIFLILVCILHVKLLRYKKCTHIYNYVINMSAFFNIILKFLSDHEVEITSAICS